MLRRRPRSTRTDTRFPYTTRIRSGARLERVDDIAGRFGSQGAGGSIDARRVDAKDHGGGRWEIFTHGGRKPTGIDAIEHAVRLASLGAGELLVTSMDRDGTRDGYDLALIRAVADAVRSEERRVGKGCVSTGRPRWSPYH